MDADIYSLMMADEPTAQQRAQALAAALRGQQQRAQVARAAGSLGMLTGDKVLSRFGAGQMQDAQQLEDGVNRQRGQMAEAGQFRLQKAMEAQRAKTSREQHLAELEARRRQELADRVASNREWDRRNSITSQQQLREAMIAAGNKQVAAERGTVIPGMEVVDGAAPTAADATKVKASLASAQRMKNYITELKDLHANHGTEFGGEVGNRMQALTQQIRLEAKNIGELGALSGPDMSIVENIAQADPGGLWANIKGTFGSDNTQGSLGSLDRWVDDTLKGNMDAYGYRPKAGATQSAPGLDGAKRKRLEELRAKKAAGVLK
jgi:hypothetical protein